MNTTKIICDAASDITIGEATELGIGLISATIFHGQRHFYETTGMTKEEYWDLLASSDIIPTTAAATPLEIKDEFVKAMHEGHTDLIVVTINAKGSVTFNNCQLAQDLFEEEYGPGKLAIEFIDSQTYTYCYGDAVIQGAKMLKEGLSKQEVLNYIKDYVSHAEGIAAVFDLKFARKSGRISGVAAFLGEMLGLKPILQIINGGVNIVEKVRGEKAIFPKLIDVAKRNAVDIENQDIRVIVGKLDETVITNFVKSIEEELKPKSVTIGKLGCSITTNAGPFIIGITFLGKKRD